mmetsp:Transcript_69603/g.194525  ORF Transcript_69603/g.194525 Transcript_69603/m.194525 type:complete len:255 (+) Transcript_69603:616-1380(+)
MVGICTFCLRPPRSTSSSTPSLERTANSTARYVRTGFPSIDSTTSPSSRSLDAGEPSHRRRTASRVGGQRIVEASRSTTAASSSPSKRTWLRPTYSYSAPSVFNEGILFAFNGSTTSLRISPGMPWNTCTSCSRPPLLTCMENEPQNASTCPFSSTTAPSCCEVGLTPLRFNVSRLQSWNRGGWLKPVMLRIESATLASCDESCVPPRRPPDKPTRVTLVPFFSCVISSSVHSSAAFTGVSPTDLGSYESTAML